ncbi:hypothetical protein PI124_g8443 [Phytophthora idaei]|nr:hypothetical protein PI124_g8443 [Phytophthora idaei]
MERLSTNRKPKCLQTSGLQSVTIAIEKKKHKTKPDAKSKTEAKAAELYATFLACKSIEKLNTKAKLSAKPQASTVQVKDNRATNMDVTKEI